MSRGDKRPRAARDPQADRNPRTRFDPAVEKTPRIGPAVRGGPIVWRFSSSDRDGAFAWSQLEDPATYKRVMERLHQFETMEERDIIGAGCHAVEIERCCKEARDRLAVIKLDDIDELFSFRITGAERVWCRMQANVMLVLWWDPEHKVCPSLKKHT